jgi:hypothetical protein
MQATLHSPPDRQRPIVLFSRICTIGRVRQSNWKLLGAVLLLVGGAQATPKHSKLTDARIRRILIDESRAAYSGSCPCPYDTDRAGRRCGRRSAYSRAGGESPLCFDHDVTKEMIEEYRKRTSDSDSE